MAAPGSSLLFLHQVAACPPNTKVRFLGWFVSLALSLPTPPTDSHPNHPSVKAYDAANATLTLSHPPSPSLVNVNISLVVVTLSFGALRDGEWVNVIGYTAGTRVDAIMLWPAAGVRLGVYEQTLREKLEADAEAA